MKYKDIVENTIVPSNLSEDEKAATYTTLYEYINSMLPKKLYRYRQCTERAFSAFYNDELWFSCGSTMNDDFDARLYCDRKKIRVWIESLILENNGYDFVMLLLGANKLPDIFKKIPVIEDIFTYVKQMPKEQVFARYNFVTKYVLDNMDSELINIVDQVQQLTKFACFSETYKSDMMWGKYSENSTGFVLEYEFDRQIYKYSIPVNGVSTDVWGSLYPMIYDNNRLDTTDYVWFLFRRRLLLLISNVAGMSFLMKSFDSVLPCPDEFMSTKLALKKSSEWKSEKEWRMFWGSNNPNLIGEKFCCVIHKPSAVYLGRKISKINEKIIVDIAKEKGLPVYKIDFNESSRKYNLKAYRYNKRC